MKKGLMLVIALLAVSCLLAAAAYNSSAVTNDGEIKVANTNTALLALNPSGGVGNKDLTADTVDGNLVFEFGRGNNPFFGGDKNYGLQKNSVYEWWSNNGPGMFSIQNRSAETIEVTLETINVPSGVTIYFQQGMGTNEGWQDATNTQITLPRILGSGWSCDIGVKIEVDDTATMDTYDNLEIIVGATAQ